MPSSHKKRSSARQSTRRISPVLLLVLSGLLLAGLAVFFALRPAAADGTARLEVDQEKLDFGDVHFNQPVTATFRLTNTGDAPLKFTKAPFIQVKAGC